MFLNLVSLIDFSCNCVLVYSWVMTSIWCAYNLQEYLPLYLTFVVLVNEMAYWVIVVVYISSLKDLMLLMVVGSM